MDKGTIINRDAFLQKIAKHLSRKPRRTDINLERPKREYTPEKEVFANASAAELLDIFKEECETIHTEMIETTAEGLEEALQSQLIKHGEGNVVIAEDERFKQFGLSATVKTESVHTWDIAKGEENIQLAERAKTGIMFSDITLAESATMVIFNDKAKARSISLLPETFIGIIPQSTIVPRMTQASEEIDRQIERGETISSCVNMISGPSNSADIEYNLVVGVHGPIRASYIVVTDR